MRARTRGAATRQAVNLEGTPVRVKVSKTFTQPVGPIDLKATISGSISVTPIVEVGLDMDWFRLKSYKVGAGLKTQESLKLEVSAGYEKSWDVELFKISVTRGGMIGPVPVWATFEGSVKAHAGISGEIRATVEWTRTGTFMSGLRGSTSDNFQPHPYKSELISAARLTSVTATGRAEAGITGTAQLSLYSLLGPYASLGYEAVGQISGPVAGPFTCELYHRPTAAVGLAGSQALQRLIGKTLTIAEHRFPFAKTTIPGCPASNPGDPGSDEDPVIATAALPDGVLNEPYRAHLAVADDRPGTWSLDSGAMPPGLGLGSSGAITGTPTTAGSYGITVRFTDSSNRSVTRALQLSVLAAPAPWPATRITAGDGDTWAFDMSGDGEHFAFSSGASNLTSGDDNGESDLFVADSSGQILRIEDEDPYPGQHPSISHDGRFVAYADAGRAFLWDSTTQESTLIGDPVYATYSADISGDGRFVVYSDSDLVMFDRQSGETQPIAGGSYLASQGSSISDDGRYVAFNSMNVLVPGDVGDDHDVFGGTAPTRAWSGCPATPTSGGNRAHLRRREVRRRRGGRSPLQRAGSFPHRVEPGYQRAARLRGGPRRAAPPALHVVRLPVLGVQPTNCQYVRCPRA